MDRFLRDRAGAVELTIRQQSKRIFNADHSEYPPNAALEEMSTERLRPDVVPSSHPCWLTDDLEYEYIKEIGQGDSAAVYKAKEIKKGKKEGRLLAVKIYKVRAKREDIDDRILDVKKEVMLMLHIRGGVSVAFSIWNF